ncbi:hypothetical protein [Mycobacterium sp.]|uniref:hypothetical protein n=1 Tax=Mycobacterium sp. TaxID=1785 RepID=UPI003C761344
MLAVAPRTRMACRRSRQGVSFSAVVERLGDFTDDVHRARRIHAAAGYHLFVGIAARSGHRWSSA